MLTEPEHSEPRCPKAPNPKTLFRCRQPVRKAHPRGACHRRGFCFRLDWPGARLFSLFSVSFRLTGFGEVILGFSDPVGFCPRGRGYRRFSAFRRGLRPSFGEMGICGARGWSRIGADSRGYTLCMVSACLPNQVSQLSFSFPQHGGRRKGAGRKRSGPRDRVSHSGRAQVRRSEPRSRDR